MSFYDNQNYLHAQPNVFNAENAIEFTVINAILNNENVLEQVYDYLLNCSRDKVNTKYKLSHDNLTACYAYLRWFVRNNEWVTILTTTEFDIVANIEFQLIKKRKELNSFHPREWAFYNLIERKGFKPLNYFLLSIVMIIGCARKYKYRTYGNGQKVRLIATDSKNLAWLRFKSGINMPITKKVCDYLIKRNFDLWKKMFGVYFIPEHPILRHPEGAYNL